MKVVFIVLLLGILLAGCGDAARRKGNRKGRHSNEYYSIIIVITIPNL